MINVKERKKEKKLKKGLVVVIRLGEFILYKILIPYQCEKKLV